MYLILNENSKKIQLWVTDIGEKRDWRHILKQYLRSALPKIPKHPKRIQPILILLIWACQFKSKTAYQGFEWVTQHAENFLNYWAWPFSFAREVRLLPLFLSRSQVNSLFF